jgi:hypothetical protein
MLIAGGKEASNSKHDTHDGRNGSMRHRRPQKLNVLFPWQWKRRMSKNMGGKGIKNMKKKENSADKSPWHSTVQIHHHKHWKNGHGKATCISVPMRLVRHPA